MIHRLLANLRPTKPPGSTPAILCSSQAFQRWAEDDPWGWSLRGRFYGARGRFLGRRFCLGEEDLARGVVSFGWHTHSAVLLPAIADRMAAGHSLVVTDISGLLLHHVQTIAAATGHLLLVHDLENPAKSCSLNLCDWLDGAAEARAVATTLLLGRVRRNSSKNKTWRRVAVDLVAACALHFRNFGDALEARQNVFRLTKDLVHSQVLGVADLVADLKKLVAKNLGLAHRMVASALDTGLALWAQPDSGPLREISSYSSLDLASQLAHVPTVMVLRCGPRRKSSHGPYLGALLHALVTRLHRVIEEWPGKRILLPVGLILDDLAALGRPGFLAGGSGQLRHSRLSILAAVESMARFDANYPDRSRAEGLVGAFGTKIVFGGCDWHTAEFFARLGEGLIHSTDITRLDKRHAIIFASGDADQAGQSRRHAVPARCSCGIILHGRPLPFDEREDWKPRRGGTKAITVIGRPPGMQLGPVPTVPPKPKGVRAERDNSGRDPAELLLEDAPESMTGKDQDLWTNETW